MPTFKQFLIAVTIIVTSTACSQSSNSVYNKPENWFQTGQKIDTNLCDVFYVLETCVRDWTDSVGEVHHLANIEDEQQRARMLPIFERAQSIFGDSVNFFAPYYPQITINVWEEGVQAVDREFPQAFGYVQMAFDYYMKHWNNGRKFVLAGYSQGGKAVKELVKSMTDEQFSRMVAAYSIGSPILAEDTIANKRFIPAQTATDQGVTISYNSVAFESGLNEAFAGSVMAINPVLWSTTNDTAQVNDSVSVHLDSKTKLLFVSGIKPDAATIAKYPNLFPLGSFHLLELPLYADYLRKNVKQRLYAQ